MSFPVRTCISCKEKYPKFQLIRIVLNEDKRLQIDLFHKISSRGYYLCKKKDCLLRAKEHNILSGVLNQKVNSRFYLDIARTAIQKKDNRLSKFIGFAEKSGYLIKGLTAVENQIRYKKIRLILFDSIIGKTTKRRIYGIYNRHKIPFIQLDPSLRIEHVIGKVNCKCIGITDIHFAREIKERFESDPRSSGV